MKYYFFDTESHRFVGATILLQYATAIAEGNACPVVLENDIRVVDLFAITAGETLEIIEDMCQSMVIGFNLSHDWFHICRTYNVLSTLDRDSVPTARSYGDAQRMLLSQGNQDAVCLKPLGAIDLMIVGRRGPLQAAMGRKPVRIRRVPLMYAYQLIPLLKKKLPFHDESIYFANNREGTDMWAVRRLHGENSCKRKGDEVTRDDLKDDRTTIDQHFCNIVLRFNPSTGLKAIAKHILHWQDTEETPLPDKKEELRHLPLANSCDESDLNAWIAHWRGDRELDYARRDVVYTIDTWKWLGKPVEADRDSALAILVANNYWAGFALDQKLISQEKRVIEREVNQLEEVLNVNSTKQVKEYLKAVMSPMERVLLTSTDKKTLALFATSKDYEATEIQERARIVIRGRTQKLELNLLSKLQEAGRLYASYKVTGTLTNRMAGGSDEGGKGKTINPQGISKSSNLRACFTYANTDERLSGGDFSGFEVAIMCAVYNDPLLNEQLSQGKKFHALLGSKLFKLTYEEIMQDNIRFKWSPKKVGYYDVSKSCTFSMAYGAQASKLAEIMTRIGTHYEPQDVEQAVKDFDIAYSKVAEGKAKLNELHSAIKQDGWGYKWNEDVEEYIETFLGFRRYFTLELKIMRVLYDLVGELPAKWHAMSDGVQLYRTGKLVTPISAVKSALLGAAFNMQNSMLRICSNHAIQSVGGEITKDLQLEFWDLQPTGISPFRVRVQNIHDELIVASVPELLPVLKERQVSFVERYKKHVPLIDMEWGTGDNWKSIH